VLWKIGAEYVVDVGGRVFELDIGDREGTDIAARTSERHPWGGRVLASLIEHLR
jgi:hypothetical protein